MQQPTAHQRIKQAKRQLVDCCGSVGDMTPGVEKDQLIQLIESMTRVVAQAVAQAVVDTPTPKPRLQVRTPPKGTPPPYSTVQDRLATIRKAKADHRDPLDEVDDDDELC
jgi:hypothetical protein